MCRLKVEMTDMWQCRKAGSQALQVRSQCLPAGAWPHLVWRDLVEDVGQQANLCRHDLPLLHARNTHAIQQRSSKRCTQRQQAMFARKACMRVNSLNQL